MDPSRLRDLPSVDRLATSVAKAVLEERRSELLGGASSQALSQTSSTLRNAAVSEEGRELLARGRFVAPLESEGFDVFGALPSPAERPAKQAQSRARKSDDEAALSRRLQTAQRELATVEHFDYVVINESDREDDTVAQISAIITAERCRLHQRRVEL